MRCPDCNKFVSLENNEPTVNEADCNADGEGVHLQYDVDMERTCADCSQTLKSFSGNCEIDTSWEDFEGWNEIPEETQKLIRDETLKVDVTASESSEVDESGGGRYKKNMITTTISVEIDGTVKHREKEYKLHAKSEGTCEAAAGEFEEAV